MRSSPQPGRESGGDVQTNLGHCVCVGRGAAGVVVPETEKLPRHEGDGIVAAAGARLRGGVEADGRTRGSGSVPPPPVVVAAATAK